MIRHGRRATTLLALALAAGCAGPRAGGLVTGGPPRGARSGLEALLANDPAASQSRLDAAVARDPKEPWARIGEALAARRTLDRPAEVQQLLAAVTAAPDHALAPVALRRLTELVEDSPVIAREIEVGLAPLAAPGRLSGLAAYRARVARISAAEVTGDLDRAVALRAENGSVPAWTLAGPFGLHHALDFDRPYSPEQGLLPPDVPAPPGAPPRPTRTLPAPDGTASLEGEPMDGDIYYLAADAELPRGGAYLLTVGCTGSAKIFVDGARVEERRAFGGYPPTLVQRPLALAAGRHRILVKLARGQGHSGLHVALPRLDGAPSDARFAPAAVGKGPAPAVPAPVPGSPVGTGRAIAAALADGGEVLARLLAARDAMGVDRESAKALLAEAIARAPDAAPLRHARADAAVDDPTLDPQIARSRAEAELRRALDRDPGDGEVRIDLAALQRDGRRLDVAEDLLAGLAPGVAARPAGLAARARLAWARGFAERALVLAGEARGQSCDALDLGYEVANRRDDVAASDQAARTLAACRNGRERLGRHLLGRGDPRAQLEVLAPLARARPAAVEPGLQRSQALVALGDLAGAARELEALLAIWPRSARIARKLADVRDLAGDRAGARAARERALALDPADLQLRRALALESGTEVLAGDAVAARAAIRAYQAAGPREDSSSAFVLDAAAVEIHPGGAATERVHQVIRVLDQRGVEQYGEIAVPSGAEVIALRTIKPDGRTLEPDSTAGGKGTVSLTGLAPGDHVDFEYLRGLRGGRGDDAEGGYAADPFFFQVAGAPLFRSTYVVRAPKGTGLEVDAHGMQAPAVAVEDGSEVVRAERTRVPTLVPEPGAPALTEFVPFLHVGVGAGRDALAREFGDAAVDRVRVSVEVRAFAEEIRAAAGPAAKPEALVRTAYAQVAKRILGQGGAFGEEASAVLSRGRGSRLVLLRAVLGALGLRARIALARPFTSDPAPYRFPGPGLYGHPLLRVEAGGTAIWLDPGMRSEPFAVIPSAILDCEALLLPEPGEAPEVARTPARSRVEEGREVAVRIALAPDGGAELSGTDRYLGASGAAAKTAIERLDPTDRRHAVEGLLARSFRGVSVDEVAFEGEDDPEAPLTIRWKGRASGFTRAANGGVVLDAPILPARLGPRLVQLAARTTPFLVLAERTSQRVEIVPPPGLAARAGPPQRLEGAFGRYQRDDRVEGGALVRLERIELARARVPPRVYPDLAAFAAGVDGLQEQPIAFAP